MPATFTVNNWMITTSTTSTNSGTAFNNWIDTTGSVSAYSPTSFRQMLRSRTAIDLANWSGRVKMPDGAFIEIDKDGNYKVNDKDAKVIYRACRFREFNRFLNASDLLEQFIREVGKMGVRQHQVMEGLFGLFLNWLVLKAAEQDGEPVPSGVTPIKQGVKLIAAPSKQPRCKACGRFISAKPMPFCSEEHVVLFWRKSNGEV